MRKLKAERRRERVIIYTTTTTIPCDAARTRTTLPNQCRPQPSIMLLRNKSYPKICKENATGAAWSESNKV